MGAKAGATFEVVGDVLDGIGDRVKDMAGLAVTVGVHSDADPYPDGTSTLAVMSVQEFGTQDVPARAPLRVYFDGKGRKELGDASAKQMGEVVDGESPQDAGEAIGAIGVEGVRGTIKAGLAPALADSTRNKPGRDSRMIPLLDTGHLISQITDKVDA